MLHLFPILFLGGVSVGIFIVGCVKAHEGSLATGAIGILATLALIC